MTTLPREIVEFMQRTNDEIASLKRWQESRDDNQKWLTRLFIGGVLTALIGNVATFMVAAVGWAVMLLANRDAVVNIVSEIVRK